MAHIASDPGKLVRELEVRIILILNLNRKSHTEDHSRSKSVEIISRS